MFTKSLLALITGAGLLLAASPSMATVIDNINVPTSPGPHVFNGSLVGHRALEIGDVISGGGTINGIDQGMGPGNLCASGGPTSCSLTYEFDNYTLADISSDGSTAFFTGGTVTFTANGSDLFLMATADFLSPDPSTSVDDTQYTLIATKTTGNRQNGAFGLLSVTGGDAMSALDNNSYSNGGGGLSDLLFNTSWSPFGEKFTGSGDIHFEVAAVPAPSELSLLLLGLALIGGGAFIRHRKNA